VKTCSEKLEHTPEVKGEKTTIGRHPPKCRVGTSKFHHQKALVGKDDPDKKELEDEGGESTKQKAKGYSLRNKHYMSSSQQIQNFSFTTRK